MSAYNPTTPRSPAPQSMCTAASQARSRTTLQPVSMPAHKKQKPFWRRSFDRKKSDPPSSASAMAIVSTPSNFPSCDLSPGALGEIIVDTNATEELPEYPRGSSPPQIKVESKDMGSFSPDDAYVTDDENPLQVMYSDRPFQETVGERQQDHAEDFRGRKKEWLADRKEKERSRLAKLLRMHARMTTLANCLKFNEADLLKEEPFEIAKPGKSRPSTGRSPGSKRGAARVERETKLRSFATCHFGWSFQSRIRTF